MIKAGDHSNDKIVTEMGYKVQSGDVVKYNNETLRGEQLVYVFAQTKGFHYNYRWSWKNAKQWWVWLRMRKRKRVYPVGRLDRNTTGLFAVYKWLATLHEN